MKSNIVNKSEFGTKVPFTRLDPEYVDRDLLDTEHRLQGLGGVRLGEVQSKNIKHFKRSDDDICFKYISIDAVDNEDGLIFPEEYSGDNLPSRAKYIVKENDILVSNVRPNRGGISLLTKSHSGHIASSGFTLVRPEKINFSNEYLFCFLKSTYGRNQLIRRNRGSMYPAVAPGDVLDVFIPFPSAELDKKISKKVQVALDQHRSFYLLQESLRRMLSSYLDKYGSPPSPLDPIFGRIDSSIVNSNNFFSKEGPLRFDAEFFRPGFDLFTRNLISKEKTFVLGDYYNLYTGRPLEVSEETISSYAKQSILTNVGINWSALREESGKVSKNAIKIQEEDILLACTAHEIEYVGKKVDYVRSVPKSILKPIGCVADLMVMRPKKEKPKKIHGSYVASFLRSEQGKYQVQRCIRGLRGGHVYRDDLSRFVVIPIPDDSFLEKFEEQSKESEYHRNYSKKSINEAVDLVEKFLKNNL